MLLPITNIQRFSTHDGPGIRTTIFLKGCPLRCKWCHNPETQSNRQQIFYTAQNCIGCRVCVDICTNHAHSFDSSDRHIFDAKLCKGCLACTEACPANGVEAVSRMMPVDEIMDIILKDRAFYGDNGGITLSGGEPLQHMEGSLELLRLAKQNGLSTAIETSGYFDEAFIEPIARLTDLFLWDYKDSNTQRHIEYTGVSNEKTLHNLFLLDNLAGNIKTTIFLRCILVKGINMDDGHLKGIAETYLRLSHCSGVELLAYHTYGGSKNEQLGCGDNGRIEWIPVDDELQAFKGRLKELGVKVI